GPAGGVHPPRGCPSRRQAVHRLSVAAQAPHDRQEAAQAQGRHARARGGLMRIVFAGTPAFALPALAALVGSEAWRPVVVLAQPDRGAGRGRKLRFGPVKQAAVEAGIEVLQPHTLKDADARAALADLRPDLIVTAAYGLLLPPEVLAMPRHGCWNLHASLLPRWRGASPINQAILAGDEQTGITLMHMDAGLDTGPVILQRAVTIGEDET